MLGVIHLDIYFFIALVATFVGGYYLYRDFFYKKSYYKKIIDNSSNIVMLLRGSSVIEVNRTFFSYFDSFDTLGDFLKEHRSICEFFENEEGCLEVSGDGVKWIDFLVAHQGEQHRVKVNIYGKIYYFLASASSIDPNHKISAIIFNNITELVKTKKALMLLTLNDTLTNVGNRRFFDQKLQEHITLSERYGTPFSLMFLDIDYFKTINDKHGHDIGDRVLIDFSKLIKETLREGDIFARIGGEEFAILLPLTTKDRAYMLAEKLREMVQNSRGITPITMSVGVVEYEKGDDTALLFKRADEHLYLAKERGRNKVVLG